MRANVLRVQSSGIPKRIFNDETPPPSTPHRDHTTETTPTTPHRDHTTADTHAIECHTK